MNRTRLGLILAAGALSAMMSVAAPFAHADKAAEHKIKSQCSEAGGTYTTVVKSNPNVKGSQRFSTCAYNDNEGNPYTDYYADGTYYGTRNGHPPT
jgi:hypothetical protein